MEIFINNNSMHGTIPDCIGDSLGDLKTADLSNNYFSGTIPQSFSKLTSMQTLILTDNVFYGRLDDDLPTNIITLDLSSNGFSGPLPYYVFTPQLSTFAASDNCFTGSIGESICDATDLFALVLTGIGSSRICSDVVFDISHKVYYSTYLEGDIPSCIFNLPTLRSLYLTGNGISGVLPELPSTTNLSLSFNRLYGTIPDSIQLRAGSFRNLDLSYNRFSGTLDTILFDPDTTIEDVDSAIVSLSSNRLSGSLPASLLNDSLSDNGVSLRVLAGNMFDCDLWDPHLPDDPDAQHYICGSNILNVTTTLYAIAFIVLLIGFGIMVKQIVRHSNSSDAKFWHELVAAIVRYLMWGENSGAANAGIRSLANMLSIFRHCALVVTVIAMFILLPTYLTIKSLNSGAYSQFTFQYGWSLSLGFMTGNGPAVLVAILWLICMLVVAYMFRCTEETSASIQHRH